MGTTDEAIKYLEHGYYLGFTGYLCKVVLCHCHVLNIMVLNQFGISIG